jgi:hypothetical protein
MYGMIPLYFRIFINVRHCATYLNGKTSLGLYEVQTPQKDAALCHIRYVRSDHIRYSCENLRYLPLFLYLELTQTVSGLNHLGRFNKDRLPRCAFIMDYTGNFTLVSG